VECECAPQPLPLLVRAARAELTNTPETARIGRELAASTPEEPTARGGAPIFRYGSGSSDVLHALLKHRVTPFRLLVGHSGGAELSFSAKGAKDATPGAPSNALAGTPRSNVGSSQGLQYASSLSRFVTRDRKYLKLFNSAIPDSQSEPFRRFAEETLEPSLLCLNGWALSTADTISTEPHVRAFVDCASPLGVETDADIVWRKDLLRKIGYKL
jgi:hypothetical protein